MKKSKIATTIVEAMVVTLIIVMGLTGVYKIYSESIKLTDSVETKIQAIQIAKEGLEAMTNIRDTNWLLFSSDKKNCWKTFNYDISCIGNAGFTNNILNNGNYKIYRDIDNRWFIEEDLLGAAGNNYATALYKSFYGVGIDSNGLYTQSGATSILKNNYTRQIKTKYTTPPGGVLGDGLEIESIVRWVDSTSTKVREVKLKTVLTNYK
ncbi:MAG: hypothetical protein PHH98_01025 [Candidatus Gracilibacteria bacterium]|nr:hypothetical protein [Candidatus Gracilibacteria bacterium]